MKDSTISNQDMQRECVSVVVPLYNRAHLVERCLDSIFKQDYRPVELIVVDNNSSDDSAEVVRRWISGHSDDKFHAKLISEMIPGAPAARETGLKMVSTPKVSFFDSDDMMRPDLLSSAMANFTAEPELDVVLWNSNIVYPDGSVKMTTIKPANIFMQQMVHSIFRPQGYMVKTEFIRSVGGWGKNLKVWNDYELGVRICLANPNIGLIDKNLAAIFHQSNSITGNSFSEKAGEWERSLDEIDKDIEMSDSPCKKELHSWVNYRRIILAAQYRKERNRAVAKQLKSKTLSDDNLSATEKSLLRLIYGYTAKGGRGAYYLWQIVNKI